MPELSVVVPTYRGEASLPELLERLRTALADRDYEVVVVNEKFGIRLTDIVSPIERVKSLT